MRTDTRQKQWEQASAQIQQAPALFYVSFPWQLWQLCPIWDGKNWEANITNRHKSWAKPELRNKNDSAEHQSNLDVSWIFRLWEWIKIANFVVEKQPTSRKLSFFSWDWCHHHWIPGWTRLCKAGNNAAFTRLPDSRKADLTANLRMRSNFGVMVTSKLESDRKRTQIACCIATYFTYMCVSI